MKIVAFVDSHGSVTAFKKLKKLVKEHKPDLILCAGDISIFGDNLDYVMHEISRLQIPSFIIHGNHESESEMRNACSLFKNTHFIHKKIMTVDDFIIFGYGGGGFSLRDKHFEHFTHRRHRKFVDKKLILLTHAPPYGTKLDNIMGSFCGNKSFTDFIKTYKPILAISGHIHENEGKQDKIDGTKIVNPGPFGKVFVF